MKECDCLVRHTKRALISQIDNVNGNGPKCTGETTPSYKCHNEVSIEDGKREELLVIVRSYTHRLLDRIRHCPLEAHFHKVSRTKFRILKADNTTTVGFDSRRICDAIFLWQDIKLILA